MAKRIKTMTPHADAPAAPAAVAAASTTTLQYATDLPTLEAVGADASHLLAILHEIRSAVGQHVVNNAIAKVMRDPAGYCAKLELQQPQQEGEAAAETDKKPKKKKKWQPPKKHTPREFRMDNYASRAVAVKFLYDGEKYAGFARQEHMDATVERFLFDALVRTRLIADIDSCDYSRCGRTDRGVSAFGQVITLRVRSNLPANAKLLDVASIDEVRAGDKFRVELPSGEVKTLTEIDYAAHMNRTLPPEIRVYSVVACVPEFNARFDCHGRVYRYFFVKNQLDVDKMREAAQQLVGLHDFRNFCRIDHNCHTFERSIRGFEIVPCETGETRDPAHQMYRFEISGQAFLWHQVRCMVQVLFMIGEGKEEPAVIERLLDTAQTPRKPQYDMASDLPLVLHDCKFDAVSFSSSPLALMQVCGHLKESWERHSIRAAIARSHLDVLESMPVAPKDAVRELDHYSPKLEQLLAARGLLDREAIAWKQIEPLLPLASRRKVLPLLTRDTADSVSERKQKMADRKRRRDEAIAAAAASATAD